MDHAPGNGRHTRKCLWLFLLMLNLQPRPYPPFCKIAYRAWSGAERNQVVFIIVTRKISKMVKLFVKYIIIEGGMLTVKKKKKLWTQRNVVYDWAVWRYLFKETLLWRSMLPESIIPPGWLRKKKENFSIIKTVCMCLSKRTYLSLFFTFGLTISKSFGTATELESQETLCYRII